MTLLDYTNPIYSYLSDPINPFYHNDEGYYNNYFPSEAELLCFDPPPLPSLFDFDIDYFTPPPPPPTTPLNIDELIVAPEGLPFFPSFEDPLYHTEDHIPLTKKPKVSYSPYDFSQCGPPVTATLPQCLNTGYSGDNYSNCQSYHYYDNSNNNNNNNNGSGSGCGGGGGGTKREVSAQSKAARERRRRITEKTHELGKLVPGGTKMNTAEMFHAASKYVKFLQAQLGLLNTINTLNQASEKEVNMSNLPILGSTLIQEKLYTKEKCLVPMDFLPILEHHLDIETKPSISKQIEEIIH